MKQAWRTQIDRRIEVTDFYLAGYSMGAAHAACVAMLDERASVFDFKKVLLINPPVNLYRSALLLDGYFRDRITDGDQFAAFWHELMQTLGAAYAQARAPVGAPEDLVYAAFRDRAVSDEDMATLIGLAFAMTAQSMITTGDLLTRSGYIIPANAELRIIDNLDHYFIVSARTSFEQYFHELLLPYYRRRDPEITAEHLIARASLRAIEDYLRGAEKMGLMHNADDVIMSPGEIEWLADVFGDRAKIYPRGGHGGNLAHTDNVAHLTEFFTR
jgi:pimeloyl-ACP methyl ester carboxylesterase